MSDEEKKHIVLDIDEVLMQRLKGVQSGDGVMSPAEFKKISSMSPEEIKRLVDDLEKRFPGFHNLLEKSGTFHHDVISPRQGTPKEDILIDDSKEICEDYQGRKL